MSYVRFMICRDHFVQAVLTQDQIVRQNDCDRAGQHMFFCTQNGVPQSQRLVLCLTSALVGQN